MATWQWNETPYGYDGVTIEGQNLVWFTHSYNELAGGGAMDQPIIEFLASGPPLFIPDDALAELVAALQLRATSDSAT